jgi:hypothetical protein
MATIRDFRVNNGLEVNVNANVANVISALDFQGNLAVPNVQPSTTFDFSRSKALDPRIQFTRASNAYFEAANGTLVLVQNNVPRFNHTNGKCRGLLIEAGSANFFTYSTNIGNTAFYSLTSGFTGSHNITLNAGPAPDGTNTASYMFHSSPNTTFKSLQYGLTLTANAIYTHSIYIKSNNEPAFSFVHSDGVDLINSLTFTYTVASNTFGAQSTSANVAITNGPSVEVLKDGWRRYWYTFRYIGANRFVTFKVDMDYSTAALNRGIFLWGAQLENKDKVSTFVPTTTAAATRASEVAVIQDEVGRNNLTSWYNKLQGTFKVEYDVNNLGSTNGTFAAQYSGYPGSLIVWDRTNGNVVIQTVVIDALASKVNFFDIFANGNSAVPVLSVTGPAATAQTTIECAVYYANNEYSITWNGNTPGGGFTTGNVVPNPNYLQIDIGRNRANHLDGHIKTITYWPVKLTNNDIVAVTTL